MKDNTFKNLVEKGDIAVPPGNTFKAIFSVSKREKGKTFYVEKIIQDDSDLRKALKTYRDNKKKREATLKNNLQNSDKNNHFDLFDYANSLDNIV